ncbi:MAG TPA: two-component regulator propeller domain-containing protein [Thermoanaerobaculia bacterium]|nr:two-component regulator propeller domain-containing protein [Thermoanaerobaculia bacterium]
MPALPSRRRGVLRRSCLLIVAVLAAVAGPLSALGPRLAITQLSRDVWQDELPQSAVLSVLQTRDGYLWLGTYEGLVRFDGVRFVVFDRQRTHDLQGTSVFHLAQDRAGRLWVSTNGGLTVHEGGRFRTYGTGDGLPSPVVRASLEARDGTLWIATDGGLAQMRDGKVQPRPDLANGEVRALAQDREGSLWAATSDGLLRVSGGRVTRMGAAEALPSPVCRHLLVDHAGALWVGTDKGLARLVYTGGAAAPRVDVYRAADGLGDDYVRALAEDDSGSLWVGTETAGLARFRSAGPDTGAGHWERFAAAQGLANDFVRSIHEDREGSLWVGTSGGLNRFREGKLVPWGTPEGLSHDFARTVFEDRDGVLWVGTDGGGVNRRVDGRWSALGTADGLSHDSVRAIAQTSDGALWFGTRNGLDRFADGHVTPFGDRLPSRLVRALAADAAGNLWIGMEGGGLARLRINQGDGTVKAFGPRDGLGADDVRTILVDRGGALWAGTYGGGLSRFDGQRFTTLRTPEGLPNDIVFALHEDDAGLWVGTDSGLALLPRRGGRIDTGRGFPTFGIANGLLDDKVFRILADRRGGLWMSSNRGVQHVREADLLAFAARKVGSVPATSYTRADGMRATQCNGASHPAGWATRDGHLWFPTVSGVVEVNPDDLKVNKLPPPLAIEEVRVDGVPVDLARHRELPAELDRLEIDFTALSLVAPEKVRFRFRLEGSDRDWVDAGGRRTAYYTHLPPGSYRFMVRAANSDGVWNDRGASVAFDVATPLWRTWWALLLYVAAAVGAIYALVHWRLRAFAAANALLEARVAERTAALDEKVHQLEASERRAHLSEATALEASRAKSVFLSNMSHELRTPLNSIIGFSQILEDKLATDVSEKHRRFLSNIRRSGEHLLQLINDLLDLSKIEAGRMELRAETLELAPLIHEVRELMRGISAEKRVEIELELPPRLPSLTTDPAKLRQVLLNLLSNAVKFSPPGAVVTVRAAPVFASEGPLHEDGVRIDVVDRGVGIAPHHQELIFEEFRQVESDLARSSEGTGLGLALVRRLLDLQGGMIRLDSAEGRGSTFTVFLPREAAPRRRGAVLAVEGPVA